MPEITQTAPLSLDPAALNAHISTLQTLSDQLSQTKMAKLSSSEMMRLAMQIASVNGQIKAFNTILKNQLQEV